MSVAPAGTAVGGTARGEAARRTGGRWYGGVSELAVDVVGAPSGRRRRRSTG
jgi:hypothetical protein